MKDRSRSMKLTTDLNGEEKHTPKYDPQRSTVKSMIRVSYGEIGAISNAISRVKHDKKLYR